MSLTASAAAGESSPVERLSPVNIISSTRDSVEARLEIDERLLGAHDEVPADLLLGIVERTIRHGLSAAEEPGTRFVLEEYSAHLFPQSAGGWLVINATLLQSGADKTTWQAVVRRAASPAMIGRDTVIGAYMHSFRRAPADAAPAAPVPPEERERATAALERNGALSSVDARREQLVQAACNVISRKGYAATTMRDIATSSGLPISTMYQYIKSKDDLLFMITNSCLTELFEYFERHLQAEGSASEKMKHAIAKYIQYVTKNRKYINLVYRETKSLSKANRDKILSLERRVLAAWEQIILDGKKSGEFSVDQPFLAANLIYFSCTIWALRYWIINETSEQEVVEMLWRFCLGGLK